ncbi:DNA-binding response regulator [Clostridium baratii]|uniref:response regulator transcription factor n=1 Tax=Clostridium baratii TaxID=1561 RepID=UPI0009A2D09F|nr:response regulator transcription factor [Clostridium baratii]OPF50559.1 DNA-binding response regulator [Clostridium baratii]OPF54197.1 DNA-binding response regulator [Clostridium baratii]OPF58761.1 DNA-binding response regulator [Clostridium baratii]OPF58867.1 DNA-binding response regulator [Clostridium baratii]
MYNITIVEDSDIIREELKKLLSKYGYNINTPTNFENIIEEVHSSKPDLILLDINLPYFDGYHICREIRKTSKVPIIIVTSRDSDMDELMSMNLGADDFVTKPYNTQILLVRIEALLRRTYGREEQSNKLTYKNFELDLSKGILISGDNKLEITKNEIKILSYLMEHKGEIVSREDLMEHLWNSDYYVDDNTLSVNVTRIRKKLQELGIENVIETRRGLGYIMP